MIAAIVPRVLPPIRFLRNNCSKLLTAEPQLLSWLTKQKKVVFKIEIQTSTSQRVTRKEETRNSRRRTRSSALQIKAITSIECYVGPQSSDKLDEHLLCLVLYVTLWHYTTFFADNLLPKLFTATACKSYVPLFTALSVWMSGSNALVFVKNEQCIGLTQREILLITDNCSV